MGSEYGVVRPFDFGAGFLADSIRRQAVEIAEMKDDSGIQVYGKLGLSLHVLARAIAEKGDIERAAALVLKGCDEVFGEGSKIIGQYKVHSSPNQALKSVGLLFLQLKKELGINVDNLRQGADKKENTQICGAAEQSQAANTSQPVPAGAGPSFIESMRRAFILRVTNG